MTETRDDGDVARRRAQRAAWEAMWGREDFAPPWLGRGTSREVVAAVEQGWFPAGAAVLDVGCGQGELAAWLAGQGFRVLGLDIAASAIARAQAQYGSLPGVEFLRHDICAQKPPGGEYRVLIDRGCFHGIADEDALAYARNLAAAAAPDARLLLFVKAYRGGTVGDPAERARQTDKVVRALASDFEIQRVADTYLDPFDGQGPGEALPGMVFWLVRAGAGRLAPAPGQPAEGTP
jgi:SAM-dependent methyltransferase